MKFKAELVADLLAINFRGQDAYGRSFDVAIDPESARRLIFKLNRILIEQEQMRKKVASSHDGGKVA